MNHTRLSPKTIRCRDHKSYNPDAAKRVFSIADWQPILNETNINISLNLFNTTLTEIFDRHTKAIENKVKCSKKNEIRIIKMNIKIIGR